MLKVYYKEYLLTYYDIYSKRHELLLKRLSKRSMDKKKFPILESQIEKSKELMEILEEFKKEEKTYIILIMVIDMKVIIEMVKQKEKELCIGMMVIDMKVIGEMIK